MSSGPENRFIQSIHRLLGAEVYRLKNHNPYASGIPDCWYSGNAGDLWVEYKFLTPPKRGSTIVDFCAGKDPMLSALQQEWLRARHKEGRKVGVIVGTPDGGLWYPGLTWEPPRPAAERLSGLLSKKSIASIITEHVHHPTVPSG